MTIATSVGHGHLGAGHMPVPALAGAGGATSAGAWLSGGGRRERLPSLTPGGRRRAGGSVVAHAVGWGLGYGELLDGGRRRATWHC